MSNTLWARCLQQLQTELTEQQVNTWIRPLQASEDEKGLNLRAPNRFVVEWVQSNCLDLIREVVAERGPDSRVTLEIGQHNSALVDVAPEAPVISSTPRTT